MSMNMSPISFKGLVTIKTKENYHSPWKTEVVKTTPKQDAALIKAYISDETSIDSAARVNGNVFDSDTRTLHTELENLIGHEIPQVKGFSKFMYLGGSYGNDLKFNCYPNDTTYNKIYYRDNGHLPSSAPRSSVVIDLMEPKERFDAAMKSLSNAQSKIQKMFVVSNQDKRLNVFTPEKTKFDESKYAHMEEVLEKTNAILAGTQSYPNKSEYVYPSTHSAYEALVEALTTAIGIPYEESTRKHCLGELSDYEMYKVHSAVEYLKATRH